MRKSRTLLTLRMILYGPIRIGLLSLGLFQAPQFLAAAAQETLTLEALTAQYLAHAPRARLARTGVAQAQARVLEAGILANPVLEVQHSQLTGYSEQTATVGMTLPLSGRRGARVEAARAGVQSAEADAHQALVMGVASLQRTAYEGIHLLQARRQLSTLLEEITRLETVARRRAESGQISGFDSLRLQSEGDLLRSQALALEVAETRTQAALQAMLGNSNPVAIEGRIQDPQTLQEGPALIELASRQGALASVRARIVQSQFLLKAAGRQALPEPSILGGVWRAQEGTTPDLGFTAGLSIPLPFTDRGRAEAAAARADLQALEAEAQALEAELRARITGGLEAARLARARALTFENEGLRRAELALRQAGLAYEAGELGLTTLMETLRTAQSAQMHALDAHFEARMAELVVQTDAGLIPGETRTAGETSIPGKNTSSGGAP